MTIRVSQRRSVVAINRRYGGSVADPGAEARTVRCAVVPGLGKL
jgi:hypothetical protein